jgi:enoyl-CoA hydratase/carnithine racemase
MAMNNAAIADNACGYVSLSRGCSSRSLRDMVNRINAMLSEPHRTGIVIYTDTTAESEAPADGYAQLLPLLWNAALPVAAQLQGRWTIDQFRVAMSCHFRLTDATFSVDYPESLPDTFFADIPAAAMKAVPAEIVHRLHDKAPLSSTHLIASGYAQAGSTAADLLRTITANRTPELIRAIMTSINGALCLNRDAALEQEASLFRRIAAQGIAP